MLNILTTTMNICRSTSRHCKNLVLNKTGMIQIASFIIYTMHLSARLQTHHQPEVLLVNDIPPFCQLTYMSNHRPCCNFACCLLTP